MDESEFTDWKAWVAPVIKRVEGVVLERRGFKPGINVLLNPRLKRTAYVADCATIAPMIHMANWCFESRGESVFTLCHELAHVLDPPIRNGTRRTIHGPGLEGALHEVLRFALECGLWAEGEYETALSGESPRLVSKTQHAAFLASE